MRGKLVVSVDHLRRTQFCLSMQFQQFTFSKKKNAESSCKYDEFIVSEFHHDSSSYPQC